MADTLNWAAVVALDDLGSLAHAFAGSTATWDYTYDAVHSRTSLTVSDPQFLYDLSVLVPTTYTNNTMNQQESALLDVPPQPQAVAFSHDLLGNMQTPLTHSYAYDAENRLTTAYVPGGNASYAYDASGLRTRKTFAGETTEYVLDGGQILAEYDGSGALLRRYVFAGLDEPVQMTTASGETYYYHADALGSVVALSDANGDLVETHAYGPSGETGAASSVSNPFRFTGREYDAESGLYYYRARYYDPALGRFLQPDPLGYADGLNLYLYVGANPINFVDPMGLYGGAQVGGFFDSLAFVPSPAGGPFPAIVSADRSQESLDASIVANAGAVAGAAAAACVVGGCHVAATAIGTATTRLGVELTISGAAAQAAIAGAATSASAFVREAAVRGVVAAELALSRLPALDGFAAGVRTAVFDAPLPAAFTRREQYAQRVGLLVGSFGDSLADLIR